MTWNRWLAAGRRTLRTGVLLGMLLGSGAGRGNAAAEPFEIVGTFRAPGTLGWQGPNAHPPGVLTVPSADAAREKIYLAYTYSGQAGALDILAVDPATGAWTQLKNPAASEYGACMVRGPDGKVYLGTRPNAHILQLDPLTGVVTDLGNPGPDSKGRRFIYQLAVAADGLIYGCTYPDARLLRCDPATGKLADLGRVWPTEEEQYALWIAASRDGFVYLAIGTSRAHLVAHHLASGERRDILEAVGGYVAEPGAVVGSTPFVYKGDDGEIYAVAGQRHFRIRGWAMEEIAREAARPEMPANRLQDGRTVAIGDREILVTDTKSGSIERRALGYEGTESAVFRVGAGPDGRLFGSSILPLHLFEVDLAARRLVDFGRLSHGEVYSFLTIGKKLHVACYDGPEGNPLMTYDPARPFAMGSGDGANPKLVNFKGANSDWRPQAMVQGQGGHIFLGSGASFGSLEGPLTIWNTATDQVEAIAGVVPNQSIVTLAMVDGLVVGGTTIFGGGGSQPTEKEAKLFIWDPARKEKLAEMTPVPGTTRLTDFLALGDGRLMGLATREKDDPANEFHVPAARATLFVFDLKTRRVECTLPLDWIPIFNSAAVRADGTVWGVAREGIFHFDPRAKRVALEAKAPRPITAGFAVIGADLYFAAGPHVYRYRRP